MKLKRSVISPERLAVLRQENSVYEICCGVEDCPCGKSLPFCGRGFFSLFIQAIYGIAFAKRNKIPYYINFGSYHYMYTDPARDTSNFWDYYFQQAFSQEYSQGNLIPNLFIELNPLRIWDRKHLIQLHKEVVSELKFQENVQQVLDVNRAVFKNSQVLGVQIRRTDHGEEIQPVHLDRILKEVDKKIAEYDHLFVATDDSRVILMLKERYGQKLLYNDVERSGNEQALHFNPAHKIRYKLGLDVLLDCYCLSLCKHAILLQSNISYAALLFNPSMAYTLLERPKVKWKRLKTLLLFYLDKYGIRKW